MKVEVRISETAAEPYAVIYTHKVTEEILKIATLIEKENCIENSILTVMDNDRIIVLRPVEVYMIRIENEKAVVYSKTHKYSSNRRLYEFETLLGNEFMRISKSTLVNLKYLDFVEPSFGGTMLLVLKNGCKDYISRKYLPTFKKYLGL